MALNILLTNDDGFDAPGIQSMQAALEAAGHNVTVVAPKENQSAQGSSLGGEEAVSSSIDVQMYDDQGNYWVDGRPAVAVDTALDALLAGQHFDIVISGTNGGENIGTSENISGTVNGALAGLRHDLPAIAISADASDAGDEGFASADAFMVDLLARLEEEREEGDALLPEGTGLTINVPDGDISGAVVTEISRKSSAEYPIIENDTGLYGSDYLPQESSGGLFNEGDQFLDGNITLSAIDGNWAADEQARSALETRLSDLLSDGLPPSPDHAPLNIMLVNEGGYQAQGLETTRNALIEAGYDVTVVAPVTSQEDRGSALTLGEFSVTEYDAGYQVDATPSTTVYTGLDALLQGANQPDLIVSGIDDGASLGLQATSSGTLAAAVASVFNYDIPAIAISAGTDENGNVPDGLYDTSADFLVEMIGDLQATQSGNGVELLPEGEGLSINVPVGADADDFAFTLTDDASDGQRSVIFNEEGEYAYSIGEAVNTDNEWSEGTHYNEGDITITPIDGSYQASDESTLALSDLLDIDYGTVTDWSLDSDTLSPSEGNDVSDQPLVPDPGWTSSIQAGIGELLQSANEGIEQLLGQMTANPAQGFQFTHTASTFSLTPWAQSYSTVHDDYRVSDAGQALSHNSLFMGADMLGQTMERSAFSLLTDSLGGMTGSQSHDVWHSDAATGVDNSLALLAGHQTMLPATFDDMSGMSEAINKLMPDVMAGQGMTTMLMGLEESNSGFDLFSA